MVDGGEGWREDVRPVAEIGAETETETETEGWAQRWLLSDAVRTAGRVQGTATAGRGQGLEPGCGTCPGDTIAICGQRSEPLLCCGYVDLSQREATPAAEEAMAVTAPLWECAYSRGRNSMIVTGTFISVV